MSASLLLLLASAVGAGEVENGTLLTYRGTMIAEKGDAALSRKSFELNLLVADKDADRGVLLWTVSEEGRGAWPWPDRFGRVETNGLWRGATGNGPSLLYERPQGLSVIPLVVPLLAAEKPLAKGQEWVEGRLTHTVEGSEKVGESNAWRVKAGTLYGTKRELLVDKQSPRVLSLREKVFIGQGEEHELKLDLVDEKQLSTDELAKARLAFDELAALRTALGHEPRTPRAVWNDEQLATLREKLPHVIELADGTPLAEIVAAAAGDAKDQKNRANAVELLAKRAVGKAAPEFELQTLGGESVKSESLRGKAVVLHFWEYRDTPLEEPYGQIGYLDYLSRQRKADKAIVLGVAVDERLGADATRRRAIAGAKKLKSFMNLSYDVLLDEGRVLKAFGDPRITGAKLPLFVVLAPDGTVTQYHSGLYEVDRDRGLKELDEALTAAAQKAE